MQVETDPVPHLIVDVRSQEDATYHPLTEELKGAVHIPGAQPTAQARPVHSVVVREDRLVRPDLCCTHVST